MIKTRYLLVVVVVISLATIGALERMEKTKREECTVLWLGDTVWWDLLIESNFAKREKK